MSRFGTARRCAVLGSPIDHSLSPALHRAAYATLGLDWTYEAFRVEAADLRAFVDALDPRWRGLSLTMPLKEAVVALGEPDPVVRELGVGNTLVLGPEGRTVHNTDVGGLAEALRAGGLGQVPSALLLGNGATARSAIAALAQVGCHQVTVLARDPGKTAGLAALAAPNGMAVAHRDWSAPVPEAHLAISTVPAAVAGLLAPAIVAVVRGVFDVVYDPWPTPLAARALAVGLPVVNGLDLLAHQAVAQVRLMTGLVVEAPVLLSAGRAELLRRQGA